MLLIDTDEMRQQYDGNLADGKAFSVQDLEFKLADPYDTFDDFKSFKG